MAPREADSSHLVHDIIHCPRRHHPLNTIFAGTCIHEATASTSYRQYGMVAQERHSDVASSPVGRVPRSARACAPCACNTRGFVLVYVSALHKWTAYPRSQGHRTAQRSNATAYAATFSLGSTPAHSSSQRQITQLTVADPVQIASGSLAAKKR
jgi:hypothetical protein